MNTKILAVLLIALGVVVLAYSGVNFTTPGRSIDFLGLHFETTVNHFIPPAVGAAALGGGIILYVFRSKQA